VQDRALQLFFYPSLTVRDFLEVFIRILNARQDRMRHGVRSKVHAIFRKFPNLGPA